MTRFDEQEQAIVLPPRGHRHAVVVAKQPRRQLTLHVSAELDARGSEIFNSGLIAVLDRQGVVLLHAALTEWLSTA